MVANSVWVSFFVRPERPSGSDTVSVDNAAPRGVDHRVGNETRSAGHGTHDSHRQGRHLIAFAASDQAVVVELAETKAWVSFQVSAIKTAQTVDADAYKLSSRGVSVG